MLSVFDCRERAGLASHEVVLGVSPCPRHETLLASYLLNLRRGERFVLEMIVADLRGFLDLGVPDYAGDVFVVLRLFLESRPHLSLRSRPRREVASSGAVDEMLSACRVGQDALPITAFATVSSDRRSAV